MAQAPPILIYEPGGGVSSPKGSNPPVYSQSGLTQLVEGQEYIDIVFGSIQTEEDWVLVGCEVENTLDIEPLNIWPGIITDRTTAGFRIQLNGLPDSDNYYLRWAVSGINIEPSLATTYFLTGPDSGEAESAATFTVSLPPSTFVNAPVIVTPAEGGLEIGVFSPEFVTLTTASPSQTFTFTPAVVGDTTITVNNDHALTDPADLDFSATPIDLPEYALTGPSTGVVSVASTDFTLDMDVSPAISGTVVVTMSDGGAGGTFTPTTINLTTAAPTGTFTYTPASTGAKTISVTNDRGLTNPGNLTYTVMLVQHLLDTLISYWKLDEASGTRSDSNGTNHLTPNNAPVGATGKINNGCLFVLASSQSVSVASNASLQTTSDFTFSAWVKLTTTPTQAILSKWGGLGLEYAMLYENTTGFSFAAGPTAIATDAAHQGATVATGVWTHVVGYYDSGTTEVYLRINDSATTQSTTCSGPVSLADDFAIGGTGFGPGTLNADALIDEVGFWKRRLTADEISFLYNGGSGNPYSSFIA